MVVGKWKEVPWFNHVNAMAKKFWYGWYYASYGEKSEIIVFVIVDKQIDIALGGSFAGGIWPE